MRIVIMFNPASGRGRSADAAKQAAAELERAGHSVRVVSSRLDTSMAWLNTELEAANLLVVCGGDGAVRLAAPSAIRRNVPVYHLPLGTENLFAREFRMGRDSADLVRSVEAWRILRVDAGIANGHFFLLMASVGFDAEVVHDLAASRGRSISHWTYVRPILRTLCRWTPAQLTVSVDGATLVKDEPGITVVANSRQYGWRIDPASGARMDDGLLDVVFMPVRSIGSLVQWIVRCRRQCQYEQRSHRSARGRCISIMAEHPIKFQLDGDPPGSTPRQPIVDATGAETVAAVQGDDPRSLVCSVVPGVLQVLAGV